jgi:hypothetical protein
MTETQRLVSAWPKLSATPRRMILAVLDAGNVVRFLME